MTAAILKRLEKEVPSFMQSVDLVAGTSTGSIIALMLANGASASEILDVYTEMLPKVFGKPRMTRAWSAKYDVRYLREALTDFFGSTTLGRLQKEVCVTAMRVDGSPSSNMPQVTSGGYWRPAVFTNMPPVPGVFPDIELSCVDACLRSSAAPTFFPVHQGYVDGGLWANNPTLVALAKGLMHYPDLRRKDVRILSIGTGQWRNAISNSSQDMGLAQWSPYLLDLLMDASALNAELSAAYMLNKDHYCRVSPSFDFPIKIDDYKTVPHLVELAESGDIQKAIDFFGAEKEEDDSDDEKNWLRQSYEWSAMVDQAWIDSMSPSPHRQEKK